VTWAAPVVILDLDDTIINFTGMAEECWRVICEESALAVGVEAGRLHQTLMVERVAFWADPELNRIGRNNLGQASRLVLQRAFDALGIVDEARVAAMADLYRERRETLVCLFPESISASEALRARGHRLAMITNGATESQRAKIVRFDLAKHFDYILVEGEFGHGKPDERVYRHALAQLAVEPADAMMVGDDLERDVAGPQAVGMRGVWVDRVGTGLPPGSTIRPDRVISSLAELL
jgi:putative hydrolase of the HAD superfamily